jgi:hypothetical protein
MVDAWFRLLVQVVWCRLIGTVYNSISHSDSVTVVPSFYLYVRAGWTGQGQVVVATFRL